MLAGRKYLEVTSELDGDDTMMQLYAQKLLEDHELQPSNTSHDALSAIGVFREHVEHEHECLTEDKESRWFSHYSHSRKHIRAWHSTFPPWSLCFLLVTLQP